MEVGDLATLSGPLLNVDVNVDLDTDLAAPIAGAVAANANVAAPISASVAANVLSDRLRRQRGVKPGRANQPAALRRFCGDVDAGRHDLAGHLAA